MANEERLAWLKKGFLNILTCIRAIPWQELARRHLPLLVGLGVLLLLCALWKLPQWYAASWDKLTNPTDIAKLESDTRATLVQAVGGLLVLVGLFFTWRNLRVTEQNSRQTLDLSYKGQINDRFTKAIEQLGAVDQGGKKKLEIRLGGIYALEQIARESLNHHWPIMEVLTTYVREHALSKVEEQRSQEDTLPSEAQPTQSTQSPPKPAADIQAILTVLGRRTRTYRKGEDHPLTLEKTDLRGAKLSIAHLEGADLQAARLEGADLKGAHLEGANLTGTHLEGADLKGAHLEGANLTGTHLEGAQLEAAHLEGMDLPSRRLPPWRMLSADELADLFFILREARLKEGPLEEVDLRAVYLEKANLQTAHMERANLTGTHLEGANFRAAHLEGANLKGAHLEGAKGLAIEQLSNVKTLYEAQLDPPLLEELQRLYPQLLEWSEEQVQE